MRYDSPKRSFHFPSSSSISDMDARYYFPEQSKFSHEAKEIDVINNTSQERENTDF